MIYTSYRCSICNRTKDIAQDNIRAMTTGCTITKGCLGQLYVIGTHEIKKPTSSVPGLTDWYPRGQAPSSPPLTPPEQLFSLSCNSSGLLTLALFLTEAEANSYQSVFLNLTQLLTTDATATTFIFSAASALTSIAGRDSNGKNLRFDQNSIDFDLVQVIVNGVQRQIGSSANELTLAPSLVMFNTPLNIGDVVEVLIFTLAPTQNVKLPFTQNSTVIPTLLTGAWGNIKWVDEYDPEVGNLKSVTQNKLWWVYSCVAVDVLSIESQILIQSITSSNNTALIPGAIGDFTNSRFLIAETPYANADRLLNFYVDLSQLTSEYLLQSKLDPTAELYASMSVIEDINPPLQLITHTVAVNSSFTAPDIITANDAISSSTTFTSVTATRILGPT